MDFDAQHFPLVWFHPQQLPDLDVASEIHNQNAEIDHFLHLQVKIKININQIPFLFESQNIKKNLKMFEI